MKALIFLFIVCCFLFFNAAQATSPLDVVIHEIAWMGTATNSADEWIELYNNTNQDINLEDWGLYEEGGETLVEPLIGIIGAKSYYLIERTDDKTVPAIEASQPPTSWGGYGLNNNGEHLQLLDNGLNVIDEINCSGGWFTGIGKPEYKTMERKNPKTEGNIAENWQNSQNTGGTPKTPNSSLPPTPTASPNPTVFPTPTPSPTPIPTADITPPKTETDKETIAPTNIFADSLKISEFIPNPKNNNGWVELSSDSNEKLDISGWKLKSGDKTFVIPSQTFISPNEFLVLYAKTTGLTLKNSDSALELYYPNDEIAQKIDYQETKENWSIAKIGNDYLWTNNPTPGLSNKKSPDQQELQPTPPKEQNLNYQTTPEPTPLETELSPTPTPLDSKHLTGLNSPWFGFILIIVFGFLAGLGLVKIRKER